MALVTAVIQVHRATLGVLDRFRPRRDRGSAPYHYVLGPASAAVLAAEQGMEVADLGYRRAATLAIAHHRRLPELLRVNGVVAALAGYARRRPDADLQLWWSQRRCHASWGAVVQPHGFGRWQERGAVIDFFLQCDSGDEPISRLTAVLAGTTNSPGGSSASRPLGFLPSWSAGASCGSWP
jgi:hypothetical protein